MAPQVVSRQICHCLFSLIVYSRICGQGNGSKSVEEITMVVSAQNVDEMSKQKATGGYGISRAVVRLRLSGRERYVAHHTAAARCVPGVRCSS